MRAVPAKHVGECFGTGFWSFLTDEIVRDVSFFSFFPLLADPLTAELLDNQWSDVFRVELENNGSFACTAARLVRNGLDPLLLLLLFYKLVHIVKSFAKVSTAKEVE